MRRGLPWALALPCLLFLACAQPFDLSGDLSGRTLSYDQNVEMEILGVPYYFKQLMTFRFNDDGKKGQYEYSLLTYGYPSQAAADAALSTGMEWFRTGGERGSFEYDATTLTLTTRIIDAWIRNAGATTAFAADYGYRPYCATIDPDCDSASRSVSQTIAFDQDNVNAVFAADGEGWTHAATTVETAVIAGAAAPERVTTETYTWTLGENVASYRASATSISTLNAVSSTTELVETSTYGVAQVFAAGGEAGTTFAAAWKEGKSATFGLERTGYAEIGTAPGIPAASEPAIGTDGTGLSGTRGVDSWWYVDMNPRAPIRQSFARRKGYIVDNASFASAARSPSRRPAKAKHE